MAQKMCVLKNTPLIFVRATRLGTFLKSCGVSSQSCCRRMNIFPARRRAGGRAGGRTGREMSSDNGFGHGQAARVHACLSSCLAACLCQVCARARVHVR
jgi:hypothetical protein